MKYEDKYEAQFDVTQDGISQACSISRAHAAIELKKPMACGIVDEGKASEQYFYESIAALDGMEVPRILGMRKLELGMMLKERGDTVLSRKMLEESKELFKSVGAEHMDSRVDHELKGFPTF